ncbi:MAG TPA: hypothetical protein VHQ47_12900 [Phycisphaerae bacterium]|nr:hypothetical protein [Phycisphaerae bacterium]
MLTMFGSLVGKAKVLGLAGVATGALALAPQAASAHDRFSFGITIAAPARVYAAPVVVAPAPVYAPAPVVVTTPAYVPAPVYTPAPVVVAAPACPAPVVVAAPVYAAPVVVETPRYYRPRPVFVGGWHHDFGWHHR